MKASHSSYDFNKSIERISEILNSSDYNYEQHTDIPSRENLTFTNGYYVKVTVLFVDMRGSKELTGKHTRPVLARIYRSYISEIVAVLNGNLNIYEIYIEGDGVWGIFNTPQKKQIDSVFNTAAQISSLIDILNIKLSKKNYSQVKVGIGIDYGESLYMKAGYKGSTINEVVWIGQVVGQAASLCSNANKNSFHKEIMVSSIIHCNLNEHNKNLLKWNSFLNCYQGNIINPTMNQWVENNG